ncbi:MAG TPA: response regulator transcription factor [Pseudonocardiaceae bacterium]|nr:response regulator transcription factor [Pseudonocardiaceae bacterium]
MASLRILAVDDHPLFRFGLSALLAEAADMEIVGEADTGRAAVAAAARLRPDLVVMDLQLPDIDGIEATRRIIAADPTTSVLILTMFEDNNSLFAAMRAGARGYLLKDAAAEDIVSTVRAVGHGQAVFGPSIARQLMAYFGTRRTVFPMLTDREQQVLALVADGYANAAIAKALQVAPKTVRNHVSSIFAKLHVASRAEAIVEARRAGFGDQTGPPG